MLEAPVPISRQLLLACSFSTPTKGHKEAGFFTIQTLLQSAYHIIINPMAAQSISYLLSLSGYAQIFIGLFLFRYIRLLANIVGFFVYKPTPIPDDPILTSNDVTVIVPTIDPFNPDFAECIESIAATGPAQIIIVAAGGQQNLHQAARYRQIIPKAEILVLPSSIANVCTIRL